MKASRLLIEYTQLMTCKKLIVICKVLLCINRYLKCNHNYIKAQVTHLQQIDILVGSIDYLQEEVNWSRGTEFPPILGQGDPKNQGCRDFLVVWWVNKLPCVMILQIGIHLNNLVPLRFQDKQGV